MRAVHVIAGLRDRDGGPAYTVPRLCKSLAASGVEVDLLSVADRGTEKQSSEPNYRDARFSWDGAHIPGLRSVRASSGLAAELRRQAQLAQVIHNHGLWLLPNIYAGREARRTKRPLVLAPRGMLSSVALSFSPLRKRAFWSVLQARAVETTTCFHATSEDEYRDIRAFGLSQPVAILPNGIDVPTRRISGPAKHDRRVALSLGRLHPKKGLDTLLRAWAEVEPSHPDWWLRIVGPSEAGYDGVLKRLVGELRLSRVSIEGPIYGDAKPAIFEASELFILPTLNENFAVTVAEALACGLPVIATKGSPWKNVEPEGCGWWVEQGPAALSAAIRRAIALPPQQLSAMGERGRAWMVRDFSWQRVARDMSALYTWLAKSGDRPGFVRID